MNNFVAAVIAMWGLAAVGTVFTKDSDCFGYSLFGTIAVGFGYFLVLTW